jgi:thiamine-monophosphate kinase
MPAEVVAGPGDDAAVIAVDRLQGTRLLLTVDAMVEGVHFAAGSMTPRQIGRRSISVALSDIAAMGASPSWVLVSLGLGGKSAWPEENVLELARGMKQRLDELGGAIVGGNLSRCGSFFISVTAAGTCTGEPMRRSGARPGDLIVVTGSLGGARQGLELLAQGKVPADHTLALRHIDPPARIAEGLGLREFAHACIDVSDGLIQDLGHILEASGVGAVVETSAIPLPDADGAAGLREEDLLEAALAGGEDYELIAAVDPGEAGRLAQLEASTSTRFTAIGTFTSRAGELKGIDKNGIERNLSEAAGWDHFKSLSENSAPSRGR